jgi:hypothetical protein
MTKAGHNPEDSECIYWRGDQSGFDLSAICYNCEYAKYGPVAPKRWWQFWL